MEQIPESAYNGREKLYGGTVLELVASELDSLPSATMAGPPTMEGTQIVIESRTGPDKNGQYESDSDIDSKIDLD